jgi:hypothetical protein
MTSCGKVEVCFLLENIANEVFFVRKHNKGSIT